MVERPRWPELDLLIVGALTIDRFPDGRTAPGGSVLHAAVALEGVARIGAVTVAGDEAAARDGLRVLRRACGPRVHAERAPETITFAHQPPGSGVRLVLESAMVKLACPARPVRPRAVLYAPIAAELNADFGGQLYAETVQVAVLQGWLRSLDPGRAVQPLPLAALHGRLVRRLATCSALVASREDLVAAAGSVAEQLDALRRLVGNGPVLCVTDGDAGATVDDHGRRWRVAPPRVVHGVDTVGAGDAFAAGLALAVGERAAPLAAARRAAAVAQRYLEARRRAMSGGGPG
jgi:ribokinase